MHHIKVSAIDSTNAFAREMIRENQLLRRTCVSAFQQLAGRGQRGTIWTSEPGKNLTFSVVEPFPVLELGRQFFLSAVIATAIIEALETFNLPLLRIKWPNDIMSANSKIGGILIENIWSNGLLSASIIGIGLNVNQKDFEGLPSAGSMMSVSGRNFDLDQVLAQLLKTIEKELDKLENLKEEEVLERYEQLLFRRDKASTFQRMDHSYFNGIIKGVSSQGKLRVENQEADILEFDLKEVRLCY